MKQELDTELILAFKSRMSRRCLILIPQMSNTGSLDASELSKYQTQCLSNIQYQVIIIILAYQIFNNNLII